MMKNEGLYNQNLFKDKTLVRNLVEAISGYKGRPVKLMEVCGTHTMAISRYGIRDVLPKSVKLISGPGCPVCVTPAYYVQAALELAGRENVIIATFGDMMRIPGEDTTLLAEKAGGRDIRIVYSPLDCVQIAESNPEKKVIFLSVGFETTIPVIALSVLQAVEKGLSNYMLLTANKTIPTVMHMLSGDKEIGVDGFLYPGHVSAIIGDGLYREIALRYGIPGVITGFEPVDILGAIHVLLRGIQNGQARVENLYARVVKPEGNPVAVETIFKVFEECDAVWRGLGKITRSGLRLKEEFRTFDAWTMLEPDAQERDFLYQGCVCGEILKGKSSPPDCMLFGKVCTPENPVGACMVSSEGTCAAYYRYG